MDSQTTVWVLIAPTKERLRPPLSSGECRLPYAAGVLLVVEAATYDNKAVQP